MTDAMWEQTLAEWVGRLPKSHRAAREYAELLEALDKLTGEVRPCWGMADGMEARMAFGNTNYSVVEERINEALAAIARATGEDK